MSTNTRRIGKYELQKLLGSGSVGEVWKSYDLQYRRAVAIKIFHTDLQSDSNFIHRLRQEGQAIASLHHPNIVRILEARIARPKAANSNITYIVMQYIEGPTLAHSIHNTSRRGAFPPISDIVYLFTQLGAALDYAHEHGIIHGNIKPANILLRLSTPTASALPVPQIGLPASYREPMLTDFGIARPTNSSIGNSALYISPEQAKGLPPTNRSDIYSLGVILYELCTGVLPFRSESPVVLMMQHINMLPTSPVLINSNIPTELSAVILRALAKDPAARFSSASQMAAALADACSVHSELNRVIIAAEAPGYNKMISAPIRPVVLTRSGNEAPPLGTNPSHQRGFASTAAQSGGTQGAPLRGQPGRTENDTRRLHEHLLLPARQSGGRNAIQGIVWPAGDTEGRGQAVWKEKEPGRDTGPIPPIPGVSMLPSHPAQLQPSRFTRPLPASPYSRVPAWATTRTPTRQTSFTDGGLKELDTPPSLAVIPSSRASLSLPRMPVGARFISPTTLPLPLPPPQKVNRLSPIYFGLAATLLLFIIGTVVGTLLLLHTQSQQTTSSRNVVGHITFQDDPSGHNDVLNIELQNIPDPAPGKSYYAWLFSSDSQGNQAVPTLLGKLTVNSGHVHFLYPGDAHHSDILASVSSLLITEEDANGVPEFPSIHQLYAVEFAQATHPTGANHASVIDQVRDLLSGEQQLNKLGVSGGLAIWLLRNSSKTWLWASNARDYWEGNNTDSKTLNFIRGQLVHILDVLEGKQFDTRDAPIARVALLEQNADASDYLDDSLSHLNTIAQSEDATADQKALAHTIQVELQQVKNWLQKVHSDAIQLLNMTDLQFMQPQTQSILDDIATQANYAYNGQSGPSSNSAQHAGMAQIYIDIERLATFNVIPLKA